MSSVLHIVARADGGTADPRIGCYVVESDVDAHGGRGELVVTEQIENAKSFENIADALAYWTKQSSVKPLRPDGKPNRPLTAFTVEVVQDGRHFTTKPFGPRE